MAWGAVTKAVQLGAKVVTLSVAGRICLRKDGIRGEKIDYMLEMRSSAKDEVKSYRG